MSTAFPPSPGWMRRWWRHAWDTAAGHPWAGKPTEKPRWSLYAACCLLITCSSVGVLAKSIREMATAGDDGWKLTLFISVVLSINSAICLHLLGRLRTLRLTRSQWSQATSRLRAYGAVFALLLIAQPVIPDSLWFSEGLFSLMTFVMTLSLFSTGLADVAEAEEQSRVSKAP